MKKFVVTCLDTQDKFAFVATAPLDALNKMLYYLNVSETDKNAVIKNSNFFHYFEYRNKTYAIMMPFGD